MSSILNPSQVKLVSEMLFENPDAKIELITPEIAGQMLKNNSGNRAKSQTRVLQFAKEMTRGWKLNGEPIIFGINSRLLNGQHRLWACIESGCSFTTWVIRGVDPTTFDTIDTGSPRTAGDVIGMTFKDLGCDPKSVASSIRWINTIRLKAWSLSAHKMSNTEIVAFLTSEPAITESAVKAKAAKQILAPGPCGGLHYLFSERDATAADKFVTDLGLGTDLVLGDPVLQLRERLIKDKVPKTRLKMQETVTLTIRAWNHRIKNIFGRTLRGSIVMDGGRPRYPEIEGPE